MNITTNTETPTATTSDALTPENSRRAALRSLGKVGLGLAFASAPAILATSGKAYASGVRMTSGGRSVEDVLNFALTLEYLESAFYTQALKVTNLIPADIRPLFETIAAHEAAHVLYLETALGLEPNEALPEFDFTAGGTLDPFTNYSTFLLLSQAFEDTGVRAYKGQVIFLTDAEDVLTDALGIHSVEARHASKVRRVRGQQGWIPGNQPDAPAAIAAVYAGMNETVKYNIDVPAVSGVSAEAVTEAWDEPLTTEEVLAIVAPFLA